MKDKEAARGSGNYARAKGFGQADVILPDWAALVIGAAFGLPFVVWAVM